jgi:hypothetical protein
MGANAVTSFPTYTTGQVLEAADLNITNCGVPTFADSTARDGAFGGTGEKTLAEGQLCYLENSNVVQYYDGSVWATVGPTTPTPSGLVCVKAETSFSAANNFTADGVFTSSYSNYKLMLNFSQSDGTGVVTVRFRSSGSSNSTTNYAHQNTYFLTSATFARTASGATSLTILPQDGNTGANGIVEISNPQLAQNTQTKQLFTNDSGNQAFYGVGAFRANTVFDGIEVAISAGTFTGYYSIFGYSKTV